MEKKTKAAICLVVSTVVCFILAYGVVVPTIIAISRSAAASGGDEDPCSLGLSPRSSSTFMQLAIATDASDCSCVGNQVLSKPGSTAVDAAIASLLCVGIVNMHSTGIGGGGVMVHYKNSTKQVTVIDFREAAPMEFSSKLQNVRKADREALMRGGSSVAVPGQLKGMEYAWSRFGGLRWQDLFEDAIDMAQDGFQVTEALCYAATLTRNNIRDSSLTTTYSNLYNLLNRIASTGSTVNSLDCQNQVQMPELARTLRSIRSQGARYFYDGYLKQQMVAELQHHQSDIRQSDFHSYRVKLGRVITSQFHGYKVYGAGPPASGAILALLLNIFDSLVPTIQDVGGGAGSRNGAINPLLRTTIFLYLCEWCLSLPHLAAGVPLSEWNSDAYHHVAEALKLVFDDSLKLGDPAFKSSVYRDVAVMLNDTHAQELVSKIPSQAQGPSYYCPAGSSCDVTRGETGQTSTGGGTTHISVFAKNGDAVAVTSTINRYFGSWIYMNSTGIIFNNQMDDFNVPGEFSDNIGNLLQPSKRPKSSATPTIITDQSGKVRLVVGAAGGTKIPSGTLHTILGILKFGEASLEDAVEIPRIYADWNITAQDFSVILEKNANNQVVQEASVLKRNYNQRVKSKMRMYKSVVESVYIDSDDRKQAVSDPRKGGAPDGLKKRSSN